MFVKRIRAGWGDMDFNAHMRNTAYLDKAADVRLMFFAENAFPIEEFIRLRIGPRIGSVTVYRNSAMGPRGSMRFGTQESSARAMMRMVMTVIAVVMISESIYFDCSPRALDFS